MSVVSCFPGNCLLIGGVVVVEDDGGLKLGVLPLLCLIFEASEVRFLRWLFVGRQP